MMTKVTERAKVCPFHVSLSFAHFCGCLVLVISTRFDSRRYTPMEKAQHTVPYIQVLHVVPERNQTGVLNESVNR